MAHQSLIIEKLAPIAEDHPASDVEYKEWINNVRPDGLMQSTSFSDRRLSPTLHGITRIDSLI